ncbi:MAG: hypothetical protein MUC96_28965, partial [Myxococcaceae bacterium]|nr:hypothetical protein [Myxococcaceae bacterium]
MVRSRAALAVMAVVSALSSCSCFQPVVERQCDAMRPCGSGWRCVDFQCLPPLPDGGAAGGSAG